MTTPNPTANRAPYVYYLDASGNEPLKFSVDGTEVTPYHETAEGLMERMEREAGCRIDSNGFDNRAVGGLMAALSRALGTNPHPPELDIVAGEVLRHNLSAAGARERKSKEALSNLLRSGLAPSDIYAMGSAFKDVT